MNEYLTKAAWFAADLRRGAQISQGVLAANAREKREKKPYHGFTRMSADQK
jgi:hypothetical protein